MFLTMGDLGELKVGDTARGSFTAALPKPPIRHMWEMVPGTGQTPPGGGLSTYLYKLVRYEADPEPVDVSKRVRTEAEIIAELNAQDTELPQRVARNEAQAKVNAAAAAAAAAATPATAAAAVLPIAMAPVSTIVKSMEQAYQPKPWFKKPVVLGSIGLGVVLAGITAVLLVRD